jgi:hypothetical protein
MEIGGVGSPNENPPDGKGEKLKPSSGLILTEEESRTTINNTCTGAVRQLRQFRSLKEVSLPPPRIAGDNVVGTNRTKREN